MSDDLISRKAAIDAISCDITVTGRRNAEVVSETIGMFVNRIKALSPASQWIPCSERLPGVYADVLCCNAYGEYIIGMPYADGDSNTGFCVDNDGEYMIDCVAWMSLPESYKGGRDG